MGIRATVKRTVKPAARRLRRIGAERRGDEPRFSCPVCGTRTVFLDTGTGEGVRRWAVCAACGAYERHRLQVDVLTNRVLPRLSAAPIECLQVAPDVLTPWLRARVDRLVTTDLFAPADLRLDLRSLDLPDRSFDLVFASHVLEHIDDDRRAIGEIRRVLRPGGIAILPVPVVAPCTVEYGAPNPAEELHVRAPGLDYFDRYRAVFDDVEVVTSEDVDQEIQPWIYEDCSRYPTPSSPLRPPLEGVRHLEAVPICSTEA